MRLATALVALTALVVVLVLRGSVPGGVDEPRSPKAQGPIVGVTEADRVVDLAASTSDTTDVIQRPMDVAGGRRIGISALSSLDDDPSAPDAGSFTVTVVTSDGTPAPGVALSFELDGDYRGTTYTQTFDEQRTGDDGRASFDLRDCAELRAAGVDAPRGMLRIIAGVLHPEPVALLLQEFPDDGDELRLELPPGGSIAVRVLGPDGGVVAEQSSVSCRLLSREAAGPRRASRHHLSRHSTAAMGGIARFEHVALQLDVALWVAADGHQSNTWRTFAGPARSGEEVEITLALGARKALIRARALNAVDAPLRSAEVVVSLGPDPLRARGTEGRPQADWARGATTDDDGRLELEVSPHLDPSARDMWIVWTDPNWKGQGPRERFGRLWLPTAVSAGAAIDAGAVMLAPAPLLAAGTVVGTDGVGLDHATLEFSERFSHEPGSAWFPVERSQVQTDAAGRFAFYGVSPATALLARVEALGYTPRQFPDLVPGESGSRFALERAPPPAPRSSLAFALVVDDVLRGVALTVSLLRVGEVRPAVFVDAPDWPTQFSRLEPGTYTLELFLSESNISFARVDGLEVRQGEVTTDSRLTPLDLSGAARRIDVEVSQPDGAPWDDALVELSPDGSMAWASRRTDGSGAVTLHVPRTCRAVSVRIAGSQDAVRVPLAPGDAVLRAVLLKP